MACKSCGVGGCGTPKNINIDPENASSQESKPSTYSCSNEGGCGCNKLNSYDWLMDMDIPTEKKFPFVEIKFRNGRKEFAQNNLNLELITGQYIIMDMPQTGGYDIGTVSLQGELVRLQMLKKKVKIDSVLFKILRVATEKELEKASQVQSRNMSALFRARQIIKELNLNMKLSDVEFQADGTRVLFYYSSEDRVDFRELIKILALEFRARIEMKQISTRQEAARIGGVGVCGRELCCSTWLTDFKNVVNTAARYQNLAINSNKLAGQCGRLKCCLNYELDTYIETLKDIPKVEILKTQKGIAKLYKTDIFRKIMWFGFNEERWIAVSVERVMEIMAMNMDDIFPANLLENEVEAKQNASSNILARVERQEKRQKREFFKEKFDKGQKKEKREQAKAERNQQPRPKMKNETTENPLKNERNPNDKVQNDKNFPNKNQNNQNQNDKKTTEKIYDRKDKIMFDMPIPDFDELKRQKENNEKTTEKPKHENQNKPKHENQNKNQDKPKHENQQQNKQKNENPNQRQDKPKHENQNQQQNQQKKTEKPQHQNEKTHTPPKTFNLPKLPDFTELPSEKQKNQQKKKQKHHPNQQNKNQEKQQQNQENQSNQKHPPRQNI